MTFRKFNWAHFLDARIRIFSTVDALTFSGGDFVTSLCFIPAKNGNWSHWRFTKLMINSNRYILWQIALNVLICGDVHVCDKLQ